MPKNIECPVCGELKTSVSTQKQNHPSGYEGEITAVDYERYIVLPEIMYRQRELEDTKNDEV